MTYMPTVTDNRSTTKYVMHKTQNNEPSNKLALVNRKYKNMHNKN